MYSWTVNHCLGILTLFAETVEFTNTASRWKRLVFSREHRIHRREKRNLRWKQSIHSEKHFLLWLWAVPCHSTCFSFLHSLKSITYVMINVLESSIAKSTSECDSRLPALWIRQEEHLHRTDVWNTPNKLLYVEFTSYFMQKCRGNERA